MGTCIDRRDLYQTSEKDSQTVDEPKVQRNSNQLSLTMAGTNSNN